MKTYIERFWEKVEIGEAGDCWEWTAYKTKKGYGRFQLSGSPERAHRVAWALTFGPVPDGLFVCHHCDNPGCVNPAHLFIGTNSDNQLDSVCKGRHKGWRGMRTSMEGTNNGQAKLIESDVLEIRRLAIETSLNNCEISKRFPVGEQQIGRIINRKRWKCI